MQRSLLLGIIMSLTLYAQSPQLLLPLDREHEAVGGDAALQMEGEKVTWKLAPAVNQSTLSFNLDKLGINPRQFDEIHIRFRPLGGLVFFAPELTAYPVKGLRRHWYSKIVMNPGEWTTARFDLRLDDDGWQRGEWQERLLNLNVNKRFLRTPGEAAWRDIEIISISFVRRPAEIAFDEFAAQLRNNADGIAWIYALQISNRLETPATIHLRLTPGTLTEFTPSWTQQDLKMAPREVRTLPFTLTLPKKRIPQLPPLYSEKVLLRAGIADEPELEIIPLHGFRPRYLWATIPPANAALDLPPIEPGKKKKLLADAERALNAEWGVPLHGPATHPQGYIDPETSENLKPETWFRHQAPKSGKIYTDEKYTLAHITGIHAENFQRANLLAQAAICNKDPGYAAAARDVFLEYTRWYSFMPATAPGSTAGRTRLGQSTLMTAFIFANVTDAYANLLNSGFLQPADRERIERDFLIPEMRALYGHTVEYSNMTVHHYEAYTRGVVAMQKHWNLFGEALYGDHGFHAMADRSFTEDGMSLEGGVYHWFTLKPLMDFVRQMDRYGVNILGERFKRVFDGTREHTPQGIVKNPMLASQYAFAYRAYRDPAYIPTLKQRGEWPPAWMTPAEAAKAESEIPPLLTRTTLQKHNGYLWLREQSARGFRALSINTIMHWERGEHDRLHFTLFDPDMLTQEIGRLTYGSKQSKLMYATPAHNAVTVDGKDQLDLPSTISVLLDRPRLPVAMITENPDSPIYPGIRFARVVAIVDGIFFIGDLQQSEKDSNHTFDWPFYGLWEPWAHKDLGNLQTTLPLAPASEALGETPWYRSLSETQTVSIPQGCSLRVPTVSGVAMGTRVKRNAPNKLLHLHVAPNPNQQLVSARIPRGYRPAPGPVLFLRQSKTSQARFGVAIAITPSGGESPVESVENLLTDTSAETAAWRLVLNDGKCYRIVVNRTGNPISVGKQTYADPLTVEQE